MSLHMSPPPPHITLALSETDDLTRWSSYLTKVAHAYDPIPLTLGSIGVFPHGEVYFLVPVVTDQLIKIHDSALQGLAEESGNPGEIYEPGKWV
jgi:2'-5' RNA ligase